MQIGAVGGRKRVVSSCIPCYTKKQKCNRRQPCNHCTRRRQPENCTYNHAPGSQLPRVLTETGSQRETPLPADHETQSQSTTSIYSSAETSPKSITSSNHETDSLASLFGHVEHSESNILALVDKLSLSEYKGQNANQDIPLDILAEIDAQTGRLPDREVFDFLIQHYVAEVHWMEQVVYVPWFLVQYQTWWKSGRPSTVMDVEFAVLFLRISSYVLQFLPSPSYTIDHIRGMALNAIRDICYDVCQRLSAICVRLNAKGSLLRVQHLSILGLRLQCEGRIGEFREALSAAIQVAQSIGLHRGRAAWLHGMHEIDKEIRCRVFCNLYIWDSLISRLLDLPPFLPSSLTSEHLPQTPWTKFQGSDSPEDYLERVAQARLANFWRGFPMKQGAEYEPTVAEERYDKFCASYLKNLPLVFALEPNEEWNQQSQKLALQRQLLHVAVYESLCHNFRPLLLRRPSQLSSVAEYKQVLLALQHRTLAAAALKTLTGVSELYDMLGRPHTRLAAIILPTFEAAVVLVGLTMDATFPGASQVDYGQIQSLDVDPLGAERALLTRERCFQAVRAALVLLKKLGEVNKMAKVAAITLTGLMAKLPNVDVASWPTLESYYDTCASFDDLFVQPFPDAFAVTTL